MIATELCARYDYTVCFTPFANLARKGVALRVYTRLTFACLTHIDFPSNRSVPQAPSCILGHATCHSASVSCPSQCALLVPP